MPPSDGLLIDEMLFILLPVAGSPIEDIYNPFLGPIDEVDKIDL
jgi:hypothetical protein